MRHSSNYRVLCIVDSEKAGLDSGQVLDKAENGIPIVSILADALVYPNCVSDY